MVFLIDEETMNIAIFCAYFYPHEGGTEKYAKELFQDLKDINITIITANTEHVKSYEKKFGMDIYRFKCWHIMGKTYPIIKPSEYKDIEKIFEESSHTFDYIITQTRFFNTTILGCRIAKKYGIPLIHIEHGTMHSPIKNPILNMFGKLYDHTIGKQIIRSADKTIGISKSSGVFIKHLYRKAEPKIVYNSIDIKEFTRTGLKDRADLKKSLKIKDEKVISFVGRIIYAKGVHDLLEATKDIDDIKVLIIGNGNYLDTLRKKYPHAKYLGQKNSAEIRKYLSITDIFVNPSYAEGLPTSVLEAGAVGTCCIATDVGGTREIIEDGVDGCLIIPKDVEGLKRKIQEIIDNKILREKYSRNISKKVRKEFSWENARKRMSEILRRD
ncbi:MAG: glycosyltransferase family 4 protein [Candidatus Woesearchaeota archaeon]